MTKKVIAAVLPLLFLCGCGAERQQTIQPEVEIFAEGPVIKAGVTRDMPGYFVVGGERYGLPYELLKAYTASKGKELLLQTGLTRSALNANLNTGETDLFISPSDGAENSGFPSLPLYSTTYVMLATTKNAPELRQAAGSIQRMMGGKMIMVSSWFEGTRSYDTLLDSLSSAYIYVTSRESFELARSLSNNEFDLLICEKSEALLAAALIHNVEQVYEFSDVVNINLVFGSGHQAMYGDFVEWFGLYKSTANYASLTNIYLNRGFGTRLATINKPNRVVGGISEWDDLVREVGEKEGVDWRLLSAIAYNESRFYPRSLSYRGAKGIMQIMPVTANYFNMGDRDLYDPRTSLIIGAKLVKSLENMLDFQEGTPEDDKLSIMLAAYNSGIGTVWRARRLAKGKGENPDSWASVSQSLMLMGDRNVTCSGDDNNCRTFNGAGETLAYVEKVREKYESYRKSVE